MAKLKQEKEFNIGVFLVGQFLRNKENIKYLELFLEEKQITKEDLLNEITQNKEAIDNHFSKEQLKNMSNLVKELNKGDK